MADYTPQQVSELLEAGDVQLIDVREPHEHEAGRIPGSRLIPLGDLPAQAGTLDKDSPVILYCKAGGRSAMATEALLSAGYDAHNMLGGFTAWHDSALSMEPENAYVADH